MAAKKHIDPGSFGQDWGPISPGNRDGKIADLHSGTCFFKGLQYLEYHGISWNMPKLIPFLPTPPGLLLDHGRHHWHFPDGGSLHHMRNPITWIDRNEDQTSGHVLSTTRRKPKVSREALRTQLSIHCLHPIQISRDFKVRLHQCHVGKSTFFTGLEIRCIESCDWIKVSTDIAKSWIIASIEIQGYTGCVVGLVHEIGTHILTRNTIIAHIPQIDWGSGGIIGLNLFPRQCIA